MTARPRRLGAARIALGLTLALGLAGAAVAWLVCGSVLRPARLLGTASAVHARIAVGRLLAKKLGRETLLLVGDSRIEALPSPTHGAGARPFVVNVGVSGSSAEEWLALLPAGVHEGARFDTAVWWAGVNDLLYGRAADTVVADHISRVALRLSHHARRVLVVEQIPVRLGSVAASQAFDARSVAVNQQVRAHLAHEAGPSVLAIHDRLRGADGQLAGWCSDDGLHLNAAGNAWLGLRIVEAQAR